LSLVKGSGPGRRHFVSAGASDATRACLPLHLAANGTIELGQEIAVVLGGDATELLVGETLHGGGRCTACS
jgi:hypothetical protein